ncbi:hypothetical protein SDC9_204358 [bioreactor metagenome]|uniref:Uncharacterized protein n=1 Tax=bioreactor metagenome TaxID=1076179 RepID=A0A645IZ17_9ZZZZ
MCRQIKQPVVRGLDYLAYTAFGNNIIIISIISIIAVVIVPVEVINLG